MPIISALANLDYLKLFKKNSAIFNHFTTVEQYFKPHFSPYLGQFSVIKAGLKVKFGFFRQLIV